MAYIAPDSKIIICKNVPLDNTYQHTIYWGASAQSAQHSYFVSKAKYSLDDQSYQRVVRGKMRVQLSADNLYDCNYMCFQNTAFGSKWFYAFITGVEYINNVTSEVTFEIDCIQTYWFDTILMPSYVEREHTDDDTIGKNLVSEDIGSPELVAQKITPFYFDSWKLVAQIKPSQLGTLISGSDVVQYDSDEKQIHPVTHTEDVSASGATDLNSWLRQHTVDNDEVTNCYMIPNAFYLPEQHQPIAFGHASTTGRPSSFIDLTSDPSNPRSYVPKNNKLLTYPYTKLLVTTSQGDSVEYKFENTYEGYIDFRLYYNYNNKPSCDLRPNNYMNKSSQRLNTLSITDFPKVELSQFMELSGKELVSAITRIGSSLARENPISAAAELVNEVGQIAFDAGTHTVNTSGANLDIAWDTFGYVVYVMGVRYQDAEIIDHYFNMFGYATKKVKVPNRNVRRQWTYTKTKNCNLKCNAPADDVQKICQIYDKGITFWSDPANVGRYDLDNDTLN